MQSTTVNKWAAAISAVIAVITWFLSPEFSAEAFGIDPENLGIAKLIANVVLLSITAYNGYQINAKSKS